MKLPGALLLLYLLPVVALAESQSRPQDQIKNPENLVSTETLSGRDAGIEVQEIFAPNDRRLPPIDAAECAVQLRPLAKSHPGTYERIEGCSFSISAGSFPMLLRSIVRGPIRHKATNVVHTSTPVPTLNVPFAISEVYYLSPPEAWGRNEPLIYVDRSRTRVLVYQHVQVEE